MVSHEDRKLQRLNKIKKTFLKAKEDNIKIDEEAFIAACIMEWGSSRRTILEYFKTVRLALDFQL